MRPTMRPNDGHVEAEDAVQVHPPQLVGDAFRRAQDLEEQAMIARILPELLVDQVQVARSGRSCRR